MALWHSSFAVVGVLIFWWGEWMREGRGLAPAKSRPPKSAGEANTSSCRALPPLQIWKIQTRPSRGEILGKAPGSLALVSIVQGIRQDEERLGSSVESKVIHREIRYLHQISRDLQLPPGAL